ncbi:hypothetical protein NQ314_012560 [Rhamnusium bicolor]|uniref:Uncharacterized protein n=1 Tax=Rhamnusium bicolor TaxID=1586634 RepID=A0AAV8XAE4_9CUCU|nr:hypothetical protein NQ314_012560 [Rhamnusium bicolor]
MTPQNLNQICQNDCKEIQKQIDALIEHKCKQLCKTSFNSKCNAIHLEQWMKGQLDGEIPVDTSEMEPVYEEWTEEMLRKRSEELQLIDAQGNVTCTTDIKRNESRCEEVILSDQDQSPSKSTTTESQCHKNCLSSSATANGSIKNYSDCNSNKNSNKTINRKFETPEKDKSDNEEDDWQPLLLLEHPYQSLSSSVATLRRFGTVSSLERVAYEDQEDAWENNVSSGSEDEDGDDEEEYEEEEEEEEEDYERGIDNGAFNHSSIKHWTVRAGSFVAEKMAFFEKLGEDYRAGGFFREPTNIDIVYLRSSENPMNGEDQQEDETSGATSGEEIWGTPTSGGELDDTLNSPNYEGKQSPNDGSLSSDFGDDTEIMMDELLMTPPISGAAMRGLLPRRTLEPLIEEEGSETSTSSSVDQSTGPSVSPEQGSGTGDVADICLAAVENPKMKEQKKTTEEGGRTVLSPPIVISTPTEVVTKIHRSESYRHIIEAAENADEDENTYFFNRFKPTAKFVNIERVPRSKSIKM